MGEGIELKLLDYSKIQKKIDKYLIQYQPSGEGGTRSPPATPHRMQNPKWPPGGPKITKGVWKGVYSLFLDVLSNFC